MEYMIRTEGVKRCFKTSGGDFWALKGIDVEIPKGALTILKGRSGSGKTTLLNALSGANVLAEDKLFATLDPTTRKFELPGGESILLTDTVGFIRKLPHHLIKAFRSTLEEAAWADILIILLDASDPEAMSQLVDRLSEEYDVAVRRIK